MPLLAADVRLLVVGDGPDAGLVREARERLEDPGRVLLLGVLDDDTCSMLRRHCDLFLMPNVATEGDVEGFGIAPLEAMYFGTPVVAFAVDALVEAVREGGWLAPAGDYPAFAGAVQGLLRSDPRGTRRRRRGGPPLLPPRVRLGHGLVPLSRILQGAEELTVHYTELDTPALCVDLDILDRNIAQLQAACDALEIDLRVHTKTHKTPAIARKQIDAGAVGIVAQKLGEAEAMAEGGIEDILIPYNIVGAPKMRRLTELVKSGRTTLTVAADSAATVEGISAAAAAAGCTVRVIVEMDTGGGRVGGAVARGDAGAGPAHRRPAGDGVPRGHDLSQPRGGPPLPRRGPPADRPAPACPCT